MNAADCMWLQDVREGAIYQDKEKEDEIEKQTSPIVEKNLVPTKQHPLIVTDLYGEGKIQNFIYEG